jgi:hypothetical protein
MNNVRDDPPKARTIAERKRDSRARKKALKAAGEAVVPVKVREGETADRLVEAGFLPEWSTEDPLEIAKAIAEALDKLLPVTRDAS